MTCYLPDCNQPDTHNGLCTPHSSTIECRRTSPITRDFVGQVRRLIESVDNDWQKQAKCWDYEINGPEDDIFHAEATVTARDYCSDCPVRAECTAQAIKDEEKWGVWGGLSVRERDGLRKLFGLKDRAKRPPAPTHGVTAYRHRHCHCDECIAAKRLARNEANARRRKVA